MEEDPPAKEFHKAIHTAQRRYVSAVIRRPGDAGSNELPAPRAPAGCSIGRNFRIAETSHSASSFMGFLCGVFCRRLDFICADRQVCAAHNDWALRVLTRIKVAYAAN